jgi:hypothetical protein
MDMDTIQMVLDFVEVVQGATAVRKEGNCK